MIDGCASGRVPPELIVHYQRFWLKKGQQLLQCLLGDLRHLYDELDWSM